MFELRKMRGYLCTRYYCSDHSKCNSQIWLWKFQNSNKCVTYVNICGKGQKDLYSLPFACSFDTLILHFNFQD